METKKQFRMPEIEVIEFDAKDVITESKYSSSGIYDVTSIKDFFNIKV